MFQKKKMNDPFANYLLNFIIVFCKFYFTNYIIEFWKKIYPIFSYFQILFCELFIVISLNFGKKFIRFFRFFKFCFANYSLNFKKKKLFDFSGFQILFRELFIEFFCVFKIYLLFRELLIQIWKIWKRSKFWSKIAI